MQDPRYGHKSNQNDTELKWFAARTIRERSYVLKYLDVYGISHSCIEDIKTLLFIHCTVKTINELRYGLFDKVLFYRSADKSHIEPVPDRVMKTFLLLKPFHDEPVIYLPVDDPDFFEGTRKRVKSGVFAGCEGIIKRIKGERRLIIRLSDRAAVATPYIPRDLLEDVPED